MYKRGLKPGLDFVIVFIALLVIWPILLLLIIFLHFTNKGAGVFFTQDRPGKNARIFKAIKFKTMTDERDSGGNLLPDAERLTKIGKIVRSLSIDELPQLINVLKGDMSVVGPRPEMLANVFNYTSVLPEFEYRLRVKAGITGHAQIAGKYNTSPKDKLILDLTYIEEYSFWLDIKLLFQTLIVLFKKDSTEAFHRGEELVFEEYQPPESVNPPVEETE